MRIIVRALIVVLVLILLALVYLLSGMSSEDVLVGAKSYRVSVERGQTFGR